MKKDRNDRDVCAPDGMFCHGQRLVRKGGKVKVCGQYWESKELLSFVGQYVGVIVDDYWIGSISIYVPSYPNGEFLITVKS